MDTNRVHRACRRKIWILLILMSCLLASINAHAQNEDRSAIIESKVFPFITSLKKSPGLLKRIGKNPELKRLAGQHRARIETALQQCNDAGCYADALKWSQDEVTVIASELIKLSTQDKSFNSLISNLRERGSYNLYASYNNTEYIRAAWNSVAEGVTHILDVYIKGKEPFYAATDSISFKPDERFFIEELKGMMSDEIKGIGEKGFFETPVNMAINALLLNGRDEAALYEPLYGGMNKKAFKKIKRVNWADYPYSVILVPGKGPEKEGINIDPQSIIRCRMAAEYFRKGAAPFIVVSGGHVHPNKTPFCEAVEMKRYLVEDLSIPEDMIFIEPYARHTTTNMRNTARMIYLFNMPADKKIVIITDPGQNGFIDKMEKRFMMELGCVPYRAIKKLSENTSEYFPDKNALQCNPKEPLDP
jgi:hypothetical protein